MLFRIEEWFTLADILYFYVIYKCNIGWRIAMGGPKRYIRYRKTTRV